MLHILGTAVVCGLVLLLLGMLGHRIIQVREGDKIIQCANKLGVLGYQNHAGSLRALCRVDDFEKALESINEEIKRGIRNPWDQTLVFVVPTFLFHAYESGKNPLHVGVDRDFNELCHELVEKATGIKKDTWRRPEYSKFDEAAHIFFPPDPRLFVPFVSEKIKKFEEQAQIYGREGRNIEYVKRYLSESLRTD